VEKRIWIDADIKALCESMPIRFSHHVSVDKPENHVLHLNNHVEIFFYVSGNHQYIVENSVYELSRGDVVIINPREVHKAFPLKRTAYERFYFLVDKHAFDAMNINPLSDILNKPSDVGNLISFDQNKREDILSMLYEISACFSDGRNDQIRALSYFMMILDEINGQLSRGNSASGSVTQTPLLLKKILTYVAENTAEIQSVKEISSELGLTPQYLSGYFSKQVGTPLKNYIQAKKIALAKNMLEKGTDVTRTCYECGFNDCSYFIKVFKKYVGMTPLTYKQKTGI
jgi:AraC-like DNA-binding protein